MCEWDRRLTPAHRPPPEAGAGSESSVRRPDEPELEAGSGGSCGAILLGDVGCCWNRADVLSQIIEKVGIMLEVGCLLDALAEAFGALVEEKLADIVSLGEFLFGFEAEMTPSHLNKVFANFGGAVCNAISDSDCVGKAGSIQMSESRKRSPRLKEDLGTVDDVRPRGPGDVIAPDFESRVARRQLVGVGNG